MFSKGFRFRKRRRRCSVICTLGPKTSVRGPNTSQGGDRADLAGAGIVWRPWIDRALKSFCDYNWITWTGPAASAKSFNASLLGLLYWLEFPEGTSVIMASTTRDALARRLWYYIQDLHSKIRPRPDLTIGQALYSEHDPPACW